MTIDERLEALTQSMGLLASLHRDSEIRQAETNQRLAQSIEVVVSLHQENEHRVVQLMDTMNRMGRILESHDIAIDDHGERLGKLEHPTQ